MTDGYVYVDDDTNPEGRLDPQSSHEGGLKAGPINVAGGEVVIEPLDPVLDRSCERTLGMAIGFKTYGDPEQAKATADHIRQMLSVELHQDIIIIHGPYDVDPVFFNGQVDRMLGADE